MDFDTGRRRFLELAGTGTALSLAGCSALQDDAASHTTTESSTDAAAAADEPRRVTVALRADQQQLQQRQQEISSELRAGNITRSEAQEQYQAAQQELLSNAIDSFRDRVESTDSLTVVGSVEPFGVFLLEGAAPTILDTLSFDSVNAILSAATFQQAKQQAQRATQTQGTDTSTQTNTTSTESTSGTTETTETSN